MAPKERYKPCLEISTVTVTVDSQLVCGTKSRLASYRPFYKRTSTCNTGTWSNHEIRGILAMWRLDRSQHGRSKAKTDNGMHNSLGGWWSSGELWGFEAQAKAQSRGVSSLTSNHCSLHFSRYGASSNTVQMSERRYIPPRINQQWSASGSKLASYLFDAWTHVPDVLMLACLTVLLQRYSYTL